MSENQRFFTIFVTEPPPDIRKNKLINNQIRENILFRHCTTNLNTTILFNVYFLGNFVS